MKKRILFKISGRVQGVMYRDFARRTANKLGIRGETENLADGTVRVEAEGDEPVLAEFEKLLSRGPFFAKVLKIEKEENDMLKNYPDFRIVYKNFMDRL